MSRRTERIEKELHHIVAQFIQKGLKDPLLGIVSVTRVQITPDLRQARVYVSILTPTGEEGIKEDDIETLNENAPQFQRDIGKKLPMKYCPKLHFHLDDSLGKALEIQNKINEISQEMSKKSLDEE